MTSWKRTFTTIVLLLAISSGATAQVEEPVVVEVLNKSTNSWDGNPLPLYPAGTPEVTIQRFIIPPNTSLPWHYHPVINAGIVTRGKLTVVTRSGEKLNLAAGDTIVETVNIWHQGINETSEPVEIIVFYAGVVNEPLAIHE